MTKQAVRMRNLSERVLTEVDIGANVLVAIPHVDRGKGDPRNLMAVVTGKEEHGYKLGIKDGILRGLYTRNQFELSDSNFIAIHCVNYDNEISFRKAVSKVSLCDGQGYTKCGCSASDMSEHIPLIVDMSEYIPLIADMSEYITLIADMSEYIPLIVDMSEYIPLIADMPKYKPIIADIPEYIPLIADMSEYIPLIVDMSEYIPLIADMPEYIPFIADMLEHIRLIADMSEHITLIADMS
ncbi:unnamed protein product [Mytilus edulis]|uniref:Uncharacterized protein n=1 Tax=Mytilus edulis TaxID=6550 RepID=A0A8S3QJR5_MYTED|nr:unnamed protein product [Mytilus edulis]